MIRFNNIIRNINYNEFSEAFNNTKPTILG